MRICWQVLGATGIAATGFAVYAWGLGLCGLEEHSCWGIKNIARLVGIVLIADGAAWALYAASLAFGLLERRRPHRIRGRQGET